MKTKVKRYAKPLYVQLKEKIKKNIENEQYAIGSQLPTEAELCELHGVSRITIRRAIAELEEEGIVQKQHGIGTFVKSAGKIKRELVSVGGFSEFLVQSGKQPKTKILSTAVVTIADVNIDSLHVELEEPILEINRLHLIDDEPIHLESSYYSLKKFPDLDKHLEESSSIYSIIKNRYKVDLVKNQKTLNVINPTMEQAALLKSSPDHSFYEIEKVAFDQDDVPIHFAKSYLPTHKVTFTITTE
ncbi:UTRA domain-containing protein [Domibacillus indicus]|uniref:UTRA domain-containing protein n=1 Tax=Domibacillus indicus TaxID=1437523 RepID=UPI00203CC9EE|nr:UTRA domain-containing protein [Domibacillus indicus]MCM3790296.1 UTRA domain-containing protein [Domibacillus indicus]